jgi:2-(1,2-epoxy-1,2-dihydrophenyl)acetyl-CoA isomerase
VYEQILFKVRDGVASVRLNRPEKLNAYTTSMGEEIVDAFARARDDVEVRVVVLAGAGRAFCAGVDLAQLKAEQAGKRAGPGPRLGEEAFLRRWPLEMLVYPKPVIAAIQGAAVGVGVTMTLPCDVRLAADTARLGLPFTRLGLLPGLGSTHLLPRLVGRARALELVLSGRTVEAREAERMGLVNRVVPEATLADEARALARRMAECAPEALAAAKRVLQHGADHGMEEAMRFEQEASAALRAGRRRA